MKETQERKKVGHACTLASLFLLRPIAWYTPNRNRGVNFPYFDLSRKFKYNIWGKLRAKLKSEIQDHEFIGLGVYSGNSVA